MRTVMLLNMQNTNQAINRILNNLDPFKSSIVWCFEYPSDFCLLIQRSFDLRLAFLHAPSWWDDITKWNKGWSLPCYYCITQ